MKKYHKFAWKTTKYFSGEGEQIPLFSENKVLKNYCLTNLNQLSEQRGTLQMVSYIKYREFGCPVANLMTGFVLSLVFQNKRFCTEMLIYLGSDFNHYPLT